jgi:hypothetical protein
MHTERRQISKSVESARSNSEAAAWARSHLLFGRSQNMLACCFTGLTRGGIEIQ